MKSRDALIRLKRFEVEEKRRKVADIEAMIGEFNHMAVDLDRQIAIEQERAGVSDVNHYAYPTFAKAALQRRNNLTASAADLALPLATGQLIEGGLRGSQEDRAAWRKRDAGADKARAGPKFVRRPRCGRGPARGELIKSYGFCVIVCLPGNRRNRLTAWRAEGQAAPGIA
jgi:hypothetical protein